jgi:gamma-glutamylcyclotransferase (GGCT)/AIG2-like uncharacterized protein YtfP
LKGVAARQGIKTVEANRPQRAIGPDGRLRTFGYGSNLCIDRLEDRLGGTGSTVYVATGYLPGYTIRFHKRSQDVHGDRVASGKANVVRTNHLADQVWGVVFSVEVARVDALDEAEGLGHGYIIQPLPVRVENADLEADVYVAEPAYVDDTLVPYDWYRRLVVDGARKWPIPAEYIATIEAGPSRPDPVTTRARRERAWTCRSPRP